MKTMPTDKGAPDLRGTPSIVGMSEWLQMMGHSVRAECLSSAPMS